MKRRARVRDLNPDRADSIVGGALVVLAVMRHLGAERRPDPRAEGLREGLALGEPRWTSHRERRIRTDLGRDALRSASRPGTRGRRRARRGLARDPAHRGPGIPRWLHAFVAELLETYASTSLDMASDRSLRAVGSTPANRSATTADLAGFSHGGSSSSPSYFVMREGTRASDRTQRLDSRRGSARGSPSGRRAGARRTSWPSGGTCRPGSPRPHLHMAPSRVRGPSFRPCTLAAEAISESIPGAFGAKLSRRSGAGPSPR